MNGHGPLPRNTDVVILGGGPAGLAAALELTDNGRSVVVVERSRYDEIRVGESLPPAIQHQLALLGAWESFRSAGHLPSFGVRSVWGSSTPHVRSFLFDAYGEGWHVDRRGFDAWLACTARERGVTLGLGKRLTGCHRRRDGTWSLHLDSGEEASEIRAGFVVDATGRSSAIARTLGVRRVTYDKLVGIVGYLSSGTGEAPPEATLLLEAVELGWWYSAPLSRDRLVVALMTDGDLCARFSLANRSAWQEQLRRATHTRRRASSLALGDLRVVGASTSRLELSHGERWLAVGDAAFAFDPLSGDGVYRALASGRTGAQAVLSLGAGEQTALERFGKDQEKTFESYLETRQEYYRQESRWAEAPFWRRRSNARESTAA